MIKTIWDALPARLTCWLTWIHALRLRVFISCALILMILQNGVWVIPNIEVLRMMSSDITRNMLLDDVRGQYLYSSFSGLALGWMTGAYKSTFTFAAMHFIAFIIGTVGLTICISRKHGDSVAKLFLVALSCAPISNVLLNWLGISDVFTYIFGTVIAISSGTPVLYLAALLLGISHMEQGIVIAIITIAKIALIDNAANLTKLGRISAVVLGIASAKIFFIAYFHAFHFDLAFTRAAFATEAYVYLFIVGFLRNLPITVYAFYSAAWVLIVCAVSYALKAKDKQFLIFLIGANGIAALTSALVYDSTRDFTLIAWPSFVAALIYIATKVDKSQIMRATMLTFASSLVLPKIIVWAGKMQSSAIFYDFLFILEKVTHKSLIAPLDVIHIVWPFAW